MQHTHEKDGGCLQSQHTHRNVLAETKTDTNSSGGRCKGQHIRRTVLMLSIFDRSPLRSTLHVCQSTGLRGQYAIDESREGGGW
jgi:hypothetical protein